MFFRVIPVVTSLSVLFISAAFAAPSSGSIASLQLEKRSSTTCDGLNGVGGFFDTAYNFTLLALNQTNIAARTQVIPAVVQHTDDADFSVLADTTSVPFHIFRWPNFSMLNGTLIANMAWPNPIPTVANNVTEGQAVGLESSFQSLPDNQAFCLIASTSPNGSPQPFPVLAVGSDADSWSLCKSNTFTNLIYKATANNNGSYDFGSCYSVIIALPDLQ